MEKMKSLTSTTIPAARRDPQALHLRKKGVKEAKAPSLCFWSKMPLRCALHQQSDKMKDFLPMINKKNKKITKNYKNIVSFRIFN